MVLIIMLLIFYFFLLIVDLIPMIHAKQYKEFAIYSVLLVLVLFVAILYAMDVNLPSPAYPIRRLVITLFKMQ